MKAHGEYLEQQTNGKIHGKFRAIKTQNEVIKDHPLETIGQIQQSVQNQLTQMLSNQGLRDANSLYEVKPEFFCFQIYNSSYQFNMLKLQLSPVYPISLWPDNGILDEDASTRSRLDSKTDIDNEGDYLIQVESDQDLIQSIHALFSSKKVQYILYRLIKMESEAAEGQNAEAASVRTG